MYLGTTSEWTKDSTDHGLVTRQASGRRGASEMGTELPVSAGG